MKRTIGLALVAFLLSFRGVAASQIPDSLTVEQAIHRVIATHPAVTEAMNSVSASAAQVRERETAFAPTVVAEGSYSRVGPTPSIAFGSESFQLFPADNWDGQVGIHHTLYDGGRRRIAVEEAQSMETSATENVQLVKSRLAYQTVRTFYGVLFLQEDLKVQDEEIRALTQHLEITRGKVEAGTATDFDVLSTEVRIATARSQRVDITNELEQGRIELRQLLGLPGGSAVVPVGEFRADTTTLDVDSLVSVALAHRPDVKMSRDAEASATVQTHLASLADKPSLSLNLAGGGKNGYVPNLNRIRADFVAGMSVQLPIYNGDRTQAQVKVSEANESVAHARTLALERTVSADVQRAVASVRAGREKMATAEVQVRQAAAALALAKTRYQAGVVTNLDVLDAQTLLAQAELVQLRARYELVEGHYALEQAVGATIW